MSSIPNTAATTPSERPSREQPSTGKSETARLALESHLKNAARFIKFLDALVLVFAWLGIGLLIWLLACVVDHWILSLPPVARWSIWSVGVVGTAWWLFRYLLPLLIHRINPIYAAHRIEHLVPEFKNGLISWLELESMPDAGVPRGVMAAIRYRAARFIGGQDPSATVDTTLLIKWMGAVALLCASLVVYAMVSPKSALATGQRILMPWASLASPTRVQFVSVEPGNTEVTQGRPLEVEVETRGLYFEEPVFVRFDTLDGQLVDQRVQLQSLNQGYQYAGTVTTSSTGIEHELRYWIEAGDAEVGPYRVRLNPLPSVTLDAIELDFPEYTQLEPRIVSAGNGIEVVEGTIAKLRGSANQPLKRGRLEVDPQLDEEGRLQRAAAYVKLDTDQKQLTGNWLLVRNEAGDNPTRYRYRLRGYNQRGDVNPRPVLHTAEVFADNPPEITLMGPEDRLLQVAPTARLRLEVRAVDPDFGLTAVTLRIAKNSEELASQRLLEDEAGHRGQRVLGFDLDIRKYDPQVGDEFQLLAVAHDNRHDPLNKQRAPNVTRSKRLTIQIVEPEQADEDSERLSNAGSDPSDSKEDQGASGAEGDRSATSSGSDDGKQAGDSSHGSEANASAADGAAEQSSGGDQAGAQTDQPPPGDQPEETDSQTSDSSGDDSSAGAASSGAQAGGEQASESDATDSNGSGSSANNQRSQASSQNDPASSSSAGQGGESGESSTNSRGSGQGGEPNQGDIGGDGKPGENTDLDAPMGSDASATGRATRDGAGGAEPSDAEPSAKDRQTLDRIQEFMERQQASGDTADPSQSNREQPRAQQPEESSPDRSQGNSSEPPSDVGEENQQRASRDDSSGSQSSESDSPASDQENEKDSARDRSPSGDPQADASSREAADSGEASDANGSGNRDGSSNAGTDAQGSQSTPSSGSDAAKGDSTDSSTTDNNRQNESGSSDGATGEDGSDRDVNQGDDGKATDATGTQSESKSSTRDSEGGDGSLGADSQASDNTPSGSQGAQQPAEQSTDGASSGSKSEEGSQSDAGSNANSDSQAASGETPQTETPQQSTSTEKDDSAIESEIQSSSPDGEQAEASDSASSGSNDTSSSSSDQGSESELGSQQSGSESSAGASQSAQPGQSPESGGASAEGGAGGDAGPADAAKRKYTDRNTDMILDYLDRQRDQPDPELLEEMSWTKDDLNNFVQRWKNARDLSQAESTGDTESDRDSLKSLGSTSRPSDALRGTDVNDAFRKQQDGGNRIRPPERLQKQYEAFQRALQNLDG